MIAAKLPYKMLGGIVPCPGGWLIVPARLAGVTVVADDPRSCETLLDVLEFKPKFDAAAIYCPIGFNDRADRRRTARATRKHATRSAGRDRSPFARHHHAPRCRPPPATEAQELEPWLTRDDLRRFRWLREADARVPTVPPAHVLRGAPRPDVRAAQRRRARCCRRRTSTTACCERIGLIRDKLPGVEEIASRTPPPGSAQVHLLQALGLLWTARRIAGRAMQRVPLDPDWDSIGHAHGTRPLNRQTGTRPPGYGDEQCALTGNFSGSTPRLATSIEDPDSSSSG